MDIPHTAPLQQAKPKTLFVKSLLLPLGIVLIAWSVKIAEIVFQLELFHYGIFPLKASGLPGILFSPFIHQDFHHLINNSIPLLVLGTALHYFYKEIAVRVWVFSFIITGTWVWFFARDSYHIGASGLVYSLALFVFVSGVIRKHPRLIAISLLVVFLYGSMLWGIFPIKDRISWESHLMGALSGIVLAFFFRNEGLQRQVYDFELEEGYDDDEDEEYFEENDNESDEFKPAKGSTGKSKAESPGYFSPPTIS